MPTYVKTDYVPEDALWYITAGKEYLISKEFKGSNSGTACMDGGVNVYVRYYGSSHIDGRAWIVINRP